MIHRIAYTLTCWMLTLGLCSGQATFEPQPHWTANAKGTLFKHAEIMDFDKRGFPIGWDDVTAFESGHAIGKNNFRGTFILTCPADGSDTSASTTIDLPEDTKYVTIVTKMRGIKITLGESKNAGAGLIFTLATDDNRKLVLPRLEPNYKSRAMGGWTDARSTIAVFPGYTKLNVRAVIDDAKGRFELDRILIMASEPNDQKLTEKLRPLRRAIGDDDAALVAKLIKRNPRTAGSA